MDQPWYRNWFNSSFYHKLYFQHDEQEAREFIARLIAHFSIPKGSRILDVACGRGRHSRILAAEGFYVTGIDLSAASISYARQFENDHLEFYEHDMRLPFRGNYFDFAFNFFTSFGYFKTRREHDDAIRTISRSLRPGGILLIDYLNTHYAEEHLVHNELKEIDHTRYEIHRWDDDSHFFKKIIVSDPLLPEPITFTEQVAKFSLGDFTDMLSFQDLQVQEVFGDYHFGHYDVRTTPRLIVVAKKKEREKEDQEKRLYSDGRATDPLT